MKGPERPELFCPRCRSPLKGHLLEDTTVDFCPKCGGIWISQEDFTRSIKKEPPEDLPEEKVLQMEEPIWAESPLACPKCARKMAKAVYDYRSGIKVDRCEECRGIWLDRGELGRLRAYIRKKIPEEQIIMAKLQAQIVKRRLETKYFREESRAWKGGISLKALLRRLGGIIRFMTRGR